MNMLLIQGMKSISHFLLQLHFDSTKQQNRTPPYIKLTEFLSSIDRRTMNQIPQFAETSLLYLPAKKHMFSLNHSNSEGCKLKHV